jgi:hypothetical protein
MATRPRRVRPDGSHSLERYGRHETAWPVDKLDVTPFVYDPARRVLIASFPKMTRSLSFAERQTIERVQERIAQLEQIGELPGRPFWGWPGSGAIAPVEAIQPGWLNHWSRDRAAYQR